MTHAVAITQSLVLRRSHWGAGVAVLLNEMEWIWLPALVLVLVLVLPVWGMRRREVKT